MGFFIEKLARSYDARRKKQYRHMLKRMYGSDEKLIRNVAFNGGDVNIYHGTRNSKAILKQGIKRSSRAKENFKHLGHQGKGIYFADKEIARRYGTELMRFKRPSELQGTKELYPNLSKISKGVLRVNPKNAPKGFNKYRYYAQATDELQNEFLSDKSVLKNGLNKKQYTKDLLDNKDALNNATPQQRAALKHDIKSNNTDVLGIMPTESDKFVIDAKRIKPSLLVKDHDDYLADTSMRIQQHNCCRNAPTLRKRSNEADNVIHTSSTLGERGKRNIRMQNLINQNKERLKQQAAQNINNDIPHGDMFNTKNKFKFNKKLGIGLGIGAGIGALGYAGYKGYKAFKNRQQDNQKIASEYIDEQFEKLASFGFGNIHQNFNSRKRKLHDIM